MKKIEVMITAGTLDAFKNSAFQLGISDFDVTEVYRSSCAPLQRPSRLCRQHRSPTRLSHRLRVGFVLFDEDVEAVLHRLLELVRPESILVFRLDREFRTIPLTNSHSGQTNCAYTGRIVSHSSFRFYPERECNSAAPNGVGIKLPSRPSH